MVHFLFLRRRRSILTCPAPFVLFPRQYGVSHTHPRRPPLSFLPPNAHLFSQNHTKLFWTQMCCVLSFSLHFLTALSGSAEATPLNLSRARWIDAR